MAGIASASLTGLARMHMAFDLPVTDRVLQPIARFFKYGEEGETEEVFATRANNLEKLIQDEGGHGCRLFRRTGDGRGRRDCAGGNLLRENSESLERIQRLNGSR